MPLPARTAGKMLLDEVALDRTLSRIAHEIIERNPDLDEVALVGIQTRGVPLAHRLRRLIAELVESSGTFRVVGTAGDGIEALQKIRELKPDVVTLDIEMPRLNGLQALEQIMAEMPRPVVMLSAAGSELGNEMTLRALERGALEFVRKPSGPVSIDLASVREQLMSALDAARAVNMKGIRAPAPPPQPPHAEPAPRKSAASPSCCTC